MFDMAEARREETRELYDQVAAGYDDLYHRPVDHLEDEAVARALLEGGFLDADYILDLGCGTGHLLDLALSVGRPIPPHRYVGVDISPGMLKVFNAKWPEHAAMKADALDFLRGQVWARGFHEAHTVVVSLFGSASYMEPNLLNYWVRQLGVGGSFIMYCTPRYRARISYCGRLKRRAPADAGVPTSWAPPFLFTPVLACLHWPHHRLWGLSWRAQTRAGYRLERRLLRVAPGLGYFLCLEDRPRPRVRAGEEPTAGAAAAEPAPDGAGVATQGVKVVGSLFRPPHGGEPGDGNAAPGVRDVA